MQDLHKGNTVNFPQRDQGDLHVERRKFDTLFVSEILRQFLVVHGAIREAQRLHTRVSLYPSDLVPSVKGGSREELPREYCDSVQLSVRVGGESEQIFVVKAILRVAELCQLFV